MPSMITVRIKSGSSSAYYKNIFLPDNKPSVTELKEQIKDLKDHWYDQVVITYIKENLRA